MASSGKKKKVEYVYDLPPLALGELARMLDPPGPSNWKVLASLMEFTDDKVLLFGLALNRMNGQSPFQEMLRVWGYDNHTVTELFHLFHKMKHVRCMEVIKKFVDPSLHKLIPSHNEPTSPCNSSSTVSSNYSSRSSSGWQCSEQLRMSVEISNRPYVDKHGIDPQSLPEPVPPPLTCSCGECNGNSDLISNPHSSSSLLCNGLQYPKQPSTAIHKPYRSLPISTHTDRSRVHNTNRTASAYSFRSDSTTSNNISSVISSSDDSDINRIDENLLHVIKTYDENNMEEKRDESPKGKQDKMKLYNLIAMNHKKYKEIIQGTNGFSEENLLGVGAFGEVYKAVLNETIFAVKRLLQTNDMGFEGERYARKYQLNEIGHLLVYRHTNIVPLSFYSLDGPEPCLVYEYMHNGSLQDRLKGKQRRDPPRWLLRLKIATGSARGIQFLHTAKERPLIHGDIKSANILLDKHDEPRIGDFGLAREGPNNTKGYTLLKTETVHGTVHYLPQEFLRNWKLSTKVDSFSFGVVLFEILTGRMAFEPNRKPPHRLLMEDVAEYFDEGGNMLTVARKLKDPRCSSWPDEIAKDFINIGRKCTAEKPKDRPDVVTVLHDLENLQVKVQTLRDSRIEAVQNTEPYQKEEAVESEAVAATQKPSPPAVPHRVPRVIDESTDDIYKPDVAIGNKKASEQSDPVEACIEKTASEQHYPVDVKNDTELTMEEKAAIKLREIEGEEACEVAKKVENLCIDAVAKKPNDVDNPVAMPPGDVADMVAMKPNDADNLVAMPPGNVEDLVAMKPCDIVDSEPKPTDSPQDSGRYSDKSKTDEYMNHMGDDVMVVPNQQVVMEIQYQQQQNYGNRYVDMDNQMPRVSREPCESSDCSISRIPHEVHHQDRFEGQNRHVHIGQDEFNRLPQHNPRTLPETHPMGGPSYQGQTTPPVHSYPRQGSPPGTTYLRSDSPPGQYPPQMMMMPQNYYHPPNHYQQQSQQLNRPYMNGSSNSNLQASPNYQPRQTQPSHNYPPHQSQRPPNYPPHQPQAYPVYPPHQSPYGAMNPARPHMFQRPQYHNDYRYYYDPQRQRNPEYAYNLLPCDMYQQHTRFDQHQNDCYDDGGMIDEYRPGDRDFVYVHPTPNSDPLYPNPMAAQGGYNPRNTQNNRQTTPRKKFGPPYTPQTPSTSPNINAENQPIMAPSMTTDHQPQAVTENAWPGNQPNRAPSTTTDRHPQGFSEDMWPQDNYQQHSFHPRVNPQMGMNAGYQEPIDRYDPRAMDFNKPGSYNSPPMGDQDQQGQHRRTYLTQRSVSTESSSDGSLPHGPDSYDDSVTPKREAVEV